VKLVILIGDSIRRSYQDQVEQTLGDRATFWHPAENGGTSVNVLAHLDEWVLGREPDVVHINAGLHDLARVPETGQARVALPQYEQNVRELLRRIRGGGASVIWALTTPVNEKWHQEHKAFDRLEADVRAYNEAASRVCAELNVPTNDLYEHVMAAGRDRLLQKDGVHFLPEGTDVLARKVVQTLEPYLG
jgi:lysophospholipase L1-like esterase